jgi:diacylglycerol kinase (ATP)
LAHGQLQFRVFFIVAVPLVYSTPLKTRFIVNPRSGRSRAILPDVQSFAATLGAGVVMTRHARHAAELAREAVAEGCELVVAVGGDGTMNEIAGALVHTPATLGLVPGGSGDGLGRHLGIHGSLRHVFRVLQSGQPRLIDSGLADGHPFFSVAGLGLEAEVAVRFNRLMHRGLSGYLRVGVAAWWDSTGCDYTIEHDGRRETFRTLTLAVANSSQYGNNTRVAPTASVEDGQLDLVAIPPLSPLNAVPLLSRLAAGSFTRAAAVRHLRGTRFVIERDAPGLLQTDGEVHEVGRRVEFIVRPGSLRIMAP